MIDAMFDMPSSDEKSLCITLEYAREKIEKTEKKQLNIA
jgi:ATP-dependent Clp protease ATP-binding subunit ClpX